jgi:hypothetical protein
MASRFAFNMDEADDGWDQDGWFDEDKQENFDINPPSHTNHASDHGKSPPFTFTSSSTDAICLCVDTTCQDETVHTVATTSDLNASPITSTTTTTTTAHTPTVSPSLSQPLDHGMMSRFAFDMDEVDDGWDQDDRFGEDDQEIFQINSPSHIKTASDCGKLPPVHVHPIIH